MPLPKKNSGTLKHYWYSYCWRNGDGGLSFDNDVCSRIHPIFEIQKDKWKVLISWKEISQTLYYEYKKSI